MTHKRRAHLTLAVPLALGVIAATLAAGCGSTDKPSGVSTAVAPTTAAETAPQTTTAAATTEAPASSEQTAPATSAPGATSEATPTGPAGTFTYADNTQIVGSELDPAHSGSEEAIALINMYEGLTRYDPATQQPKPILAESWTSNPEKTQWTFQLRDGVTFHSGRPLDAAAAKESIDRTIEAQAYGAYVWGTCTDVSAPERLTLVFKCESPTALDFNATSWYGAWIYDTKAAGDADLREWLGAGEGDAGTGPYTIDDYQKGADVEVRLKAYPDYWGGWDGAHYENVVYRVVPNAQTAAQLIESGEVQFVPRTSPEIFASFAESDTVSALDPPSFTNMFAMVNTGRPPLDDRSVRQALAYGIDLEGLSTVLKGSLQPPSGLLPPGMMGHFDDLQKYEHDPAKAAQLLDAKGYGPGGKNLKLSVSYITGDPTETAAVQLMKANLEALNVTLDLQALQWPVMWERAKSSNLDERQDLFMFLWFPDYVDPASWFTNMFMTQDPPFFNLGYYSNPEIDEQITEAVDLTAVDRDQAAQTYRAIQEKLLVDLPAIPLGDIKNQFLLAKSVGGYEFNPSYYTGVIVHDLTPS